MPTDEQLIRKIRRSRSREAADTLISRYYKEIYAYTYRQTGEQELSMDLTQEIFIAILQGIDSFDVRKAQFRTWMYRVASNKITDYYRSRQHQKKLLETPFPEEDTDGGQFFAAADSLLEQVLNRDLVRRAMTVIVQFDTDWIRIFQKKCFEERTFAEIAQELGLSENTVKTRFYTMVRRVKKEVCTDEN